MSVTTEIDISCIKIADYMYLIKVVRELDSHFLNQVHVFFSALLSIV